MRRIHVFFLGLAALLAAGCSPEPIDLKRVEPSEAGSSAAPPATELDPVARSDEVLRSSMARIEESIGDVADTVDPQSAAAIASTMSEAVDKIEGALAEEPDGVIEMIIGRLRYAAIALERGDIEEGLAHARAVLRTYQVSFGRDGANATPGLRDGPPSDS